jgi:peptidoglycan/LPS O-acetylase OafA/YrhL
VLLSFQPTLSKLFANGVMQSLGKHSYCLYLVHPGVALFLQRSHFYAGNLSYAIELIGFSYALSLLLWHLVEKQALKLKSLFSFEN